MNAKRILYATDFSQSSRAALPYASALAAESGATLYIVHVDDATPGMTIGHIGYGYLPQVDEIAAEELDELHGIRPTVEGVAYEHRFARGNAADEILRIASEEHIDLIVIGTHGRTGVGRLLMGSVAESLVRRSSCPVLTLKQPLISSSQPS